jgi:hypothetical protein
MNNTRTEIVWDADCEQVAEFRYLLDCRDYEDIFEEGINCAIEKLQKWHDEGWKDLYRSAFIDRKDDNNFYTCIALSKYRDETDEERKERKNLEKRLGENKEERLKMYLMLKEEFENG